MLELEVVSSDLFWSSPVAPHRPRHFKGAFALCYRSEQRHNIVAKVVLGPVLEGLEHMDSMYELARILVANYRKQLELYYSEELV